MSANLNELENATVGMTVGVIEVLCLQPFNYAKNMLQQANVTIVGKMSMIVNVDPKL